MFPFRVGTINGFVVCVYVKYSIIIMYEVNNTMAGRHNEQLFLLSVSYVLDRKDCCMIVSAPIAKFLAGCSIKR